MNINRQKMINELSEVMFLNLWDEGFKELLISEGFKGYSNYSDDELLEEYKRYMGIEEVAV